MQCCKTIIATNAATTAYGPTPSHFSIIKCYTFKFLLLNKSLAGNNSHSYYFLKQLLIFSQNTPLFTNDLCQLFFSNDLFKSSNKDNYTFISTSRRVESLPLRIMTNKLLNAFINRFRNK